MGDCAYARFYAKNGKSSDKEGSSIDRKDEG